MRHYYRIQPRFNAQALAYRCQLQQLASMASRRLPAHLVAVASRLAWEA